jgi:hypothetical protein
MKGHHAYKPAGAYCPAAWALDVLHEGVTYVEANGVLEDRFGGQYLVSVYRTQPRTQIQYDGESLQESGIAIRQLTQHAFPVSCTIREPRS